MEGFQLEQTSWPNGTIRLFLFQVTGCKLPKVIVKSGSLNPLSALPSWGVNLYLREDR